MKQCFRDSRLFYYHKDKKLQGMAYIHVDDFLSSGNTLFEENIMKKLQQIYIFRKTSKGNFEYTGLNISQNNKKEVFVDQNNRLLRKTTGQLNWIAAQTRPDLSFEPFHLSTKFNRALFKDTRY